MIAKILFLSTLLVLGCDPKDRSDERCRDEVLVPQGWHSSGRVRCSHELHTILEVDGPVMCKCPKVDSAEEDPEFPTRSSW